MADIKITALKNGPYKVEGPIELFYGDLRVDKPAHRVSVSLWSFEQKTFLRRHAFQNRLPGGCRNGA
jgi:hypothetical protein